MAYSLSVSVSQSHGPGANQSTVTAIVYLRGYSSGGGNYAYYGYTTNWSVNIGGNSTGGSGPRSLNTDQWGNVNSTDSTVEVGRHSVTFNHEWNGYRGAVGVSAGFSGDGGYSPGNLSASNTAGALDWDRRAYTPATPTLSRGDGGTDIRMYTNNPGAGYGNSIDYYHWYYSTDGSNFSYLSQQGSDWTWTDANPTQTYWFRVYAHAPDDATHNNGWSGPSGIAGINGAPLKPSKPSVTSSNPATQAIFSQGNNGNSLAIQYYQYRYSDNNGSTWTEVPYTTGSSWTFSTPDQAKSYVFSTRAYNSSGWGAWSDPQYGIPGKPASVTTNTPVGLKATVYAGVSPGLEITNYHVSASKDNGINWETEIPMGLDKEYQYSGLSGGKNYLFRVRSSNASGYSAYTILATPVFVPAGGKRWTGTEFVPTATVKRKTETGWDTVTIAKRWTGTKWEVLT